MRIFRAVVLALVAAAAVGCGSGGSLFRQYEYEEDVYLSLDGTATVYVNRSIAGARRPARHVVRPRSSARVDRDAVRAVLHDAGHARDGGHRVAPQRPAIRPRAARRGRHPPAGRGGALRVVRLRPPPDRHAVSVYRRRSARRPTSRSAGSGWNGREIVAFRLHLPSKIDYHNAGAANLRRGNILVWEQPLTDRLSGMPLVLDARMQTQSILYSDADAVRRRRAWPSRVHVRDRDRGGETERR